MRFIVVFLIRAACVLLFSTTKQYFSEKTQNAVFSAETSCFPPRSRIFRPHSMFSTRRVFYKLPGYLDPDPDAPSLVFHPGFSVSPIRS